MDVFLLRKKGRKIRSFRFNFNMFWEYGFRVLDLDQNLDK